MAFPDIPVRQLPLIPPARLQGVAREILLDLLPPDSQLYPKPEPGLVQSVAAFGVLEPVLLTDYGEGAFGVEGGCRRIQAARAAGMQFIPAIVFAPGQVADGIIALQENMLRKPNKLAELEHIEKLLAAGYSVEEIARRGVAPAIIKARLALRALVPALRTAYRAGQIGEGVAGAAAKLRPTQQQELAALLAERGALRHADIQQVKRVQHAQALPLFAEAFATPDAPEETPRDSRERARTLLAEAQELLGADPAAAAVAAALAAFDAPATKAPRKRRAAKDVATA